MSRLQDRVAIVTGAGSGIGRGIALRYGREGASVVVADLNEPSGLETVDIIVSGGGKAHFVKVDISSEEMVKNMIAETIATYGKLDILVNNAGLFNVETEKIPDLELSKWNWIMSINLTGTFTCCKYAIPELLKSPNACIINISSPAGADISMRAAYGASKAGIISLTKSVAIQYPGKIRSNCILPGSIDTPARAKSRKNNVHAKGSVGQLIQRDGLPEDIGAAAAYLASDDGSFVTAAIMRVDGGLLSQRPKPEDVGLPPNT